jgi:hypothetical protein
MHAIKFSEETAPAPIESGIVELASRRAERDALRSFRQRARDWFTGAPSREARATLDQLTPAEHAKRYRNHWKAYVGDLALASKAPAETLPNDWRLILIGAGLLGFEVVGGGKAGLAVLQALDQYAGARSVDRRGTADSRLYRGRSVPRDGQGTEPVAAFVPRGEGSRLRDDRRLHQATDSPRGRSRDRGRGARSLRARKPIGALSADRRLRHSSPACVRARQEARLGATEAGTPACGHADAGDRARDDGQQEFDAHRVGRQRYAQGADRFASSFRSPLEAPAPGLDDFCNEVEAASGNRHDYARKTPPKTGV